MPDNDKDMYTVMQRALETIEKAFGTDIFEQPDKFKSALYDVKIDTNAKRIRNLLFIAVCDLKAYSRLKNTVASDYIFVVDNIAGEMFSDYMIDRDVSRSVIECIAVPLGYKPPMRSSPEPLKPSPLQPTPETPPAPVVSQARQPSTMPNQSYGISIKPKAGSIIPFGGYDWRVLEVQSGRALIITKDIIALKTYDNEGVEVTWEDCSLRKYLNTWFYDTFSPSDRKRIISTHIRGTSSGRDTDDYIFLLSIDEARNTNYFKNNADRVALYRGEASGWWLRSPGDYIGTAAHVYAGGNITALGIIVHIVSGGVRPALWLNL